MIKSIGIFDGPDSYRVLLSGDFFSISSLLQGVAVIPVALLASSVLLLLLILFRQHRASHLLRTQVAQLSHRTEKERQRLRNTVAVLASKLKEQEEKLRHLDQVQLEIASIQPEDMAYGQVQKLLNLGVEQQQLTEIGMSSAEAQLASLMHRHRR